MANKKRKKRIAPGPGLEITRRQAVERPNAYDIPLDMLSIVEWHPDLNAELPPEQVHLVLRLGGESEDDKLDLLLRFQSPDTMGFIASLSKNSSPIGNGSGPIRSRSTQMLR